MKQLLIAAFILVFTATSLTAGYFENARSGQSHYTGQEGPVMLGGPAKAPASASANMNYPIIDTGDLQVMYWDKYKKIVDDHGSKMPADIGIWRADKVPQGWFILGDAVVGTGKGGGYPAPNFPILLVKDDSAAVPLAGGEISNPVQLVGPPRLSPPVLPGAPVSPEVIAPSKSANSKLAKPLRFEDKFNIWGGNNMHHSLHLWKPIAPQGYRCLGLVGTYGGSTPNNLKESYRCVREDLLVTTAGRFKGVKVWEKQSSDHMGSTPARFAVYMTVDSGKKVEVVGATRFGGATPAVVNSQKPVIFSNVISDSKVVRIEKKNIGFGTIKIPVWGVVPAELRTNTPDQIALDLKKNYSGTMIDSFADKMSEAVTTANPPAASVLTAADKELASAKSKPTYNAFLKSYNSAPYPDKDKRDSGSSDSTNEENSSADSKSYDLNGLLQEFGLDQVSYSSPQFKQGTIQRDKGGYAETYSIAKVTLNNVSLPTKLIHYLADDERFNLGLFINPQKSYSGDVLLLARNYSGKGTALAVVLPTAVPALQTDSPLFKEYRQIIPGLPTGAQPAAVVLGHVRWADKIKQKKIPGLDADFIWKLKEIPSEFRAPFEKIAGSKASDSFNPAFVFHHGASALLGLDLKAIPALNLVGKVLAKKPPLLVFSLLPRGSQVDNYDLKVVAVPDTDINRSALFPGIDKSLDNFSFTTPRIEVKSTFATPVTVLASVKSWFSFSLNSEQKLKAYTVIAVPLTAGVDSGIEFAGFVDATVKNPFGLVDQGKFPDVRLVNPELGGKLGTSGWTVWMGGQPLFKGKPVCKISFIRGGVTPKPPFVSFVDLELEKSSLTNLAGPLSKGAISAIGDSTDFKPFPTDMFQLGPFTWEGQLVSKGPRLIFSDVTLDTVGITKGVTSMGSLSLDAGDSHQQIELGKFEFVYQAAGTIAGRGRTKSLHLGVLEFVGKDAADPLLDLYLNNSPAAINNHILFAGAIRLAGKNSASYIRINSKDDIAVSLSSDSLGFGQLELSAKGSLLSLIDEGKGNQLVFSGSVNDKGFTFPFSRDIAISAAAITVVQQALKLVGDHLFDFESLTLESSPETLDKSQINKAILKASAFGKSFSVTLSQPTPAAQVKEKLTKLAIAEIKKIAEELVPDPFKFLDDLADDAKNRSKEELKNFEKLAGSRSPKQFADNAQSLVTDHAEQARDAANKAADVAKDTAKKASQAAKNVANSIYNSISDFFGGLF